MNRQVYEEATSWLVKHSEGDLDCNDKRAFDRWLRESPQHVRAYLEMSGVWQDVSALDPEWNPTSEQLISRARTEGNIWRFADIAARLTVREPPRQPRSAHLEKREELEPSGAFRPYVPETTEQATQVKPDSLAMTNATAAELQPMRPTRIATMRRFAVAAAFVVCVLGVTTWSWLNRGVYVTELGEQRSIVLADGSTVELNSRSRVKVRYSGSQRRVDLLEGQALFRVVHDNARPFFVHSGSANVRAVGTQFDVQKRRAGTIVTVVEGKVAVSSSYQWPETKTAAPVERSPDFAPDRSRRQSHSRSASTFVGTTASEIDRTKVIFLTTGEQLDVPAVEAPGAGRLSANPRHVNVAATTAWTRRTLVFEAATLADVVEQFNRNNIRQLVITDPELADIHITGVFSSVDPALLLEFLRTQSELNVAEDETQIRISKRRE